MSSSQNRGGDLRPTYRSPLADAPAFLLLLCFSVFLPLVVIYEYPRNLAFATAILVAVGWGLIGTVRANLSSLPVACMLCVLSLGGAFWMSLCLDLATASPGPIQIESTVLYERGWGYGRIALVSAPEGKYVVQLGQRASVGAGDRLFVSGRLEPFQRAKRAGEFDEFLYWRGKGARGVVKEVSVSVVGKSNGVPVWREALGRRIRDTLPPRVAGYLLASWVGERDADLASLHRSAGTSHLLAVSGFHVGILYAICWFALRRFRCRLLLIGAAIWGYVMLTGASPSSLRAAFMIQMILLGRIVGRSGKSFNSAGVAGVAMLLWNPWLYWDIGWRLSMLAALGITALASSDVAPRTRASLLTPLVWLATSVQAAWTFGAVPVAGLVVNFLALPVFGVLLPLASVVALPALFGMAFGHPLALVAEFFFARWERISENLVYLFPWQLPYSAALLLANVAALSYFFARASGFSVNRARFAVSFLTIACAILPALV